jgi:hypothetical protein
MPAYGSGTHWPLQQAEAPLQSKTSKHAEPPTVVVVVGPPTVVVDDEDVVVVVGRRRRFRFRGPHTPPRQTRSKAPAVMQAASLVQYSTPGSSATQTPSQWKPAGQFSVDPKQLPTVHLSP